MWVRESGSVGKASAALRQKPGPSVRQTPHRARIADRRYRRPPIPAQNVARRASIHQKPGASVLTVPVSRANADGLTVYQLVFKSVS